MTRLMYSLPGEWVDRAAGPSQRPHINRIVVIKADHIGDLLIATQALELLRQFFPRASIDLVCGPWNVALAKRLGLFDHVYEVNIFHQVSDRQADHDFALAAKRKGAARLEGLALGPYDLAIDLRYDSDTRSVLPAIDARVYAGFGNSREFPFLDIVLPIHHGSAADGQDTAVTLSARQFRSVQASGSAEAAGAAGRFSSSNSLVEIGLSIEGARSPDECGTVIGDRRPLGVALEAIDLEPIDDSGEISTEPVRLIGADILFLSGWANREAWGTWALGTHARLAMRVPASMEASQLSVVLFLLGHVNVTNPVVTCTAEPEGGSEIAVRFTYPDNTGRIALVVARPEGVGKLVSEPLRLAAGEYAGVARLYVPREVDADMSVAISISDATTTITLWRSQFGIRHLKRGLCDLPLRFKTELGETSLVVAISVSDARKFDGTSIEFFSLHCVHALKARVPVAHMEHWASLLVLRVAQMFSTEPPFGASGILESLKVNGLDRETLGTTHMIVSRLRTWQQAGACVVALAMGCNSAIRTWPFTYYVELARELLQVERVRLVFIGGPGESAAAAEACKLLGLNPDQHALCGLTPLDELGAVLEACDLFVGNNTGTTHFAGKIGVRTIGIYSGTNHPKEWGPVGPNASWVVRDEPCAPCFLTDLRDCKHGHVCLRNLMPGEVLDVVLPEVLAVLDQRQPMEVEAMVRR